MKIIIKSTLPAMFLTLASCTTTGERLAANHCTTLQGNERAAALINRFADAKSGIMVAAHRGCWRETAENAISAIRACTNMGVDMIEIDVRRSSDGVLILMHDETVDRTTNGTGLVSDLSLKQLRDLRLKAHAGGDDSAVTGEHIPTLEEALLAAKGKVLVNIDAKDDIRRDALAMASKIGMLDQIVVKASAQSPEQLMGQKPDYLGQGQFMPIVRETDEPLSAIIEGYASIAPEAFEVIYTDAGFIGEGAAAARAADARIWINTIFESLAPGHSDDRAILEPEAHWGVLIRDGASIFQTDHPRELLNYLQDTGQHCS